MRHNGVAEWHFESIYSEMSFVPVNPSKEIERLQAELRETQGRLQSVADLSGSLMGTLEFELRDDGRLLLVAANAVADQLLGRSCATFTGQPFLALFPELQGAEILDGLQGVARQGHALGPDRLLGAGALSGKSFNFFAFQLAPERVVVKFWDGSDATESRKPDMRLQQQLAAMFNLSPLPISLSTELDGVYVDVNEEWTRLTGISLQDALGRTTVEVGLWSDTQHRESVLDSMRQSGRLRNLDVSFVRADGGKLILQLNAIRIEIGGVAYILSYLKDMTWERTVQSELLAGEQLLKATNSRLNRQIALFELMESLAAVGYWNAPVGQGSVRWSKGLYQLAGLEPGSVLDTVAGRSRIHDEDRPQFEQARARMDGAVVEYRWHHPDGRVHWLRSRMGRGVGDRGEAFDYGVVQDITNEREAALALEEKLGFIQTITSRAPGLVFQLRRQIDGTYKFLYISEPVREIYRGVTPEQVIQDASFTLNLHHPDDSDGFIASIEASARNLAPWTHEYRLRFDDGEVRWLLGQAVPQRESGGAVLWNGFTTDITLRKQAEESLRISEARFRALTELSSDWYWEQDENYQFVRFEGGQVAAEEKAGMGRHGKTRWEIGALNMTEADWDAHRAKLALRESFHDLELQDTDTDGHRYWMALSGEPIFDAKGVFRGYRGIGRNITGRKRAEEKIERLAFYDSLTGLPNRRLLIDRLQHALAFSDRDRIPGALLFIDLDNFKDLNDTQGHDMGDQLLKQVAIRVGECVREADTVARLGGDEFVVMLENLSLNANEAAAHAEGVGRKILSTLNQPYRLGINEFHSSASIGITLFQDHLLGIDELLKRADLAMYQAKAAGRNTLRFFDPEMQAAVATRATMESDLRQGLQRQELLLYYQPVVNRDGLMMGVEALVRWQHPQRGMVSPGDFIPLAEQTGLIVPLGQWVLETACAQLAAWSSQSSTARLSVSVNVSARQFRQAEFASNLLTLLRESGANPYRLKLEITESLLLNDAEDVIHKIGELRSIGVSFALDDFGTGYSSLAYLKRLPLEQLKIDQSFVRDVMTDPNDAAIVQAVLTLGQSLGLTVVAEGVETEAQRDFLARHGCQMFQGYLFSRPVPADQLPLDGIAAPSLPGGPGLWVI